MEESNNADSAPIEYDNLVIFPGKTASFPYSVQTLYPNDRLTYNRVNYVIGTYLAAGGFGAIYGGYDESNPQHRVVIKEMLTAIPEALVRDEYTAKLFIERNLWQGKKSIDVDAGKFYDELIDSLGNNQPAQKYKDNIDVAFFNYFGIQPKDLALGRTMRFQPIDCAEFIKQCAVQYLGTTDAQRLRDTIDEAKERFFRESQILGKLDNIQGIPQLIGIVKSDEYTNPASEKYMVEYLLQDYIAGNTLNKELHLGTANPQLWNQKQTVQFIRNLLSVVEEFQNLNVVHNDLTPSNIIVGQNQEPWIIDWGNANYANHRQHTQQKVNTILFTEGYCSPEQFQGKQTTLSSDVYSAGIILYEMLTGKSPQDSAFLTLKYHEREQKIQNDLEKEDAMGFRIIQKNLASIVLKATTEDVNKRYPDAKSMRNELDKIKIESGIQRYARKRKTSLRIAGGIIAASLTFGGIYEVRNILETNKENNRQSAAATATAYAPILATQIAQDKITADIALIQMYPQYNLVDLNEAEDFKNKVLVLYRHPEIEIDYTRYYDDYIYYTAYNNFNTPDIETTKRKLKEYYSQVKNDPRYDQKSDEEILIEFFKIVPVYGLDKPLEQKCKLMEAYNLKCK